MPLSRFEADSEEYPSRWQLIDLADPRRLVPHGVVAVRERGSAGFSPANSSSYHLPAIGACTARPSVDLTLFWQANQGAERLTEARSERKETPDGVSEKTRSRHGVRRGISRYLTRHERPPGGPSYTL